MPKLKQVTKENSAQHLILYGPPFSGKTSFAAQVAKKFKVLYIDGENGVDALLKLDSKETDESIRLTTEQMDNIFVQKVHDSKDDPRLISSALLLASGQKIQMCDKHGIVMNGKGAKCVPCATENAEINEWTLRDMAPSEWVIIFDSFTQIVSSANAHVTRDLKGDFAKEEYKHWRAQGKLLERFLDYLQDAPYNVILITHEEGISLEDGTEKIVPSGGTKNFARTVAKYFNGALYLRVRNKKHQILSRTTDDPKILTGVHGTDTISNGDDLCKYFGK